MRWKKLLLIKPNYRTIGWDFYNTNFPPISLTYIASYLRELDIEVKIIDAKYENLNLNQLRKKIRNFHPDLVGITVFVSASINLCFDIARIVKHININCTVLFGGRHPTFQSEEVLNNKYVDIIVRGEGEITLRELILNGDPKNVKGTSYKLNDKVIHNPDRLLIPMKEYRNIRIPARSLVKNNRYKLLTMRFDTIESSRGCPYSCKFCTTNVVNNNTWRPRPVDRIIKELKIISNNRRITDIFFVDDNLTHKTTRIIELCDEIIKLKKNGEINDFKFFAQLRVDDLVKSPNMVSKMAKAGFWVVFIGIESTNEETLKDIHKGFTFQKVLQALRILNQNNIVSIGNLIIGCDLNQTEEEVKRDILFIKKIDVDMVTHVLLTPFPGSKTLQEMEQQGLVVTKDWTKYTVMEPVIKTHKLNPCQLQNLLHYSFRAIKYVNKRRSLLYKIYKTRGIRFFLNPLRVLSFLKAYLNIKSLFMDDSLN